VSHHRYWDAARTVVFLGAIGWDALGAIRLTREQMEQRRMAAARDLKRGVKQADEAGKYGVSEAAVSVWARRLRQGGMKALQMRRAPGRIPSSTLGTWPGSPACS
jgi:hypothetical protein